MKRGGFLKRSKGFSTTLKSKKPLKGTGLKTKKNGGKGSSLKSRSKKRSKEESEYSKLRKAFLTENPYCAQIKFHGCSGRATTIHHSRGRVGRLLTDKRWFIPLCMECHSWVEENHKYARMVIWHGVRVQCLPAEFNVFPEII